MNRTLYLNLTSRFAVREIIETQCLQSITPTPQSARSLNHPHLSLESLARQICQQHEVKIASAIATHRSLSRAIRRILPTVNVEGTAQLMTPAIKAVLRSGVAPEALSIIESEQVQRLAKVVSEYQAQLQTSGLIDTTASLWRATQLQTDNQLARQPICVYGYSQPRPDELAFLDALAGDGSVLLLPCAESGEFLHNQQAIHWLQQQGWTIRSSSLEEVIDSSVGEQVQQRFLQLGTIPPSVQCQEYANLEAEVRGVLAQVKRLLVQGVVASEIVLVARDDAFYGPTVLDIAWEYQIPVRALYAVPIHETRLGSWLQLLLEVVQANFPFEPTAKLLSHTLAAALPEQTWAEARRRHPQGRLAWEQLGVDLSVLYWKQRSTRAEWVQRLQDTLKKFDLRQRCGRWAQEIVAYYTIQDGLVELSKPETERLSLVEFAEEILMLLSLLTVPAQPGRGGVELHTPLSIAGAHYAHVFVLGAAEGMLPAVVQDDPVLDFYERKQLIRHGFPFDDATTAARREAVSFYALLGTATEQLTCSYPKLLGKDATLPSPYLLRLGLEPSPHVLPIASVEEARSIYLQQESLPEDIVLPRAIHAWTVEQRREKNQFWDEYDGVVGLPLNPATWVFSASQLTQLGHCPFKWFASHILKLRELDEAETELSPSLRGRLYHKTLELVFEQPLHEGDARQQILTRLEPAFQTAVALVSLPALPAWDARRQEHLTRLQTAISATDFLQDGATVLAQELRFTGQWYGLKVQGVIDRVDKTDDGLILLDYKTSSSKPTGAKDANGRATVDIQLPLYVQAAAPVLFPDFPTQSAYYYSLTKGATLQTVTINEAALSEVADRVKRHLEQGDYPVQPDCDAAACKYCSIDLVCRQGARLKRKGGTE